MKTINQTVAVQLISLVVRMRATAGAVKAGGLVEVDIALLLRGFSLVTN